MHSYLVNNSEHKKAKAVNRNASATISHNQYKDVSLNKKRLRHSMNRIQSKDYKMGPYEVRKTMYVQNNGCDGLALCCQS